MIYVNNLFDENAMLSFDRERGGRARLGFNIGQPRTIGLTLASASADALTADAISDPSWRRRGLVPKKRMTESAAAPCSLPARARRRPPPCPKPLAPSAGAGAATSSSIGAGVFGAWTARKLQEAGQRVLLLDAWGPAHARASSGGDRG